MGLYLSGLIPEYVLLLIIYRDLSIKTHSYYKTKNWVSAIERAVSSCEYAQDNRFGSFAPERKELANWYVVMMELSPPN